MIRDCARTFHQEAQAIMWAENIRKLGNAKNITMLIARDYESGQMIYTVCWNVKD